MCLYTNYKFNINAMAFEASVIKNKIKNHHKNIIILWCLCKYFEEYGDTNGLQHHEKIKLRGAMNDIAKLKSKNKDEENIKQQVFEEKWYDGEDYGTNYMSVISAFSKKFDNEKIFNAKSRTFVANEFCKESRKLVSLMCAGNYEQIVNYLNTTFTVGGDV